MVSAFLELPTVFEYKLQLKVNDVQYFGHCILNTKRTAFPFS